MFLNEISAAKAMVLGAIGATAVTGAILWTGGDELERVKEQAKNMSGQVVALAEDTHIFSKQVDGLKAEEKRLKQVEAELNASVNKLTDEKKTLETNLASTQATLADKQAALDAALTQGNAKDGEIVTLKNEVAKQQALVASEQKKLADLKADINRDAQAAAAAAQEIAKAATDKYNKQKGEADIMKAELNKANARAEQLEVEVNTYKKAADAAVANAAKPATK